MKASIDRDECIGCGLCESICPEVFKLDSESLATVIQDPIDPANYETALDARDSCPTSCITVEE
ncbi:MAG: ferredoxin [Gudongella sp.]|jgi:ferredoxin|nr:ferredoxin [Gudongella sp.]